ncbi:MULTISPECIES: diguanylate cyclase domain-containing protein [unclassified Halomonas]|uniref:sensor domain-containing diguanylate cyclase n=1 Tax=unclassified Halomonas TaxID=2609666 RepID=UPI001CF59A38|nr:MULTISPECIES: diguanylate cyclase [unclassified Halomonas]MCA8863420.1 diguanylate cyclase [Halomonas sp. SBBP1]UZH08739.1 diguanylate cyclase [Halomonas sp. BDJS001]
MQPSLRRPHRLALAIIAPRIFAFCHTFGLTVWIAVAEGSGWTLILPGMLLLLWPVVAYALAAHAQNSKRAEFRNLLFDSLLFGFWCSVLDFYVLATITIGLACLMNNLVVGGVRKMLIAAGLFILAALFGSALTGFTFRPYVSNRLDIYQWAGAVVYFLTIGRVTYSQNRQIGRSIGETRFQNRVFHALLDLGAVANRAINIHTLLVDSLNHLQTHFPDYGFAVFLQERQRSEVTRFAAVAGLSSEDEKRLRCLLANVHGQGGDPATLPQTEAGENLYVASMAGRLSMYEGWLIVKAPSRDDGLEQILSLFADQLAAATENKLLHLELKKTAERDGLTGLYNRGFLESALQMSIQGKVQTPNLDFAVLMLDVDRLKDVNDHYGHVAGDQLIACVAQYLQFHCRDSDILARYGGDEFVILFPSADLTAARRMANLIQENLPEQRCTIDTASGEHEELMLHVSIGCASSSEVPAQQVFALADERMYANKSQRRKQWADGLGTASRPFL